MSRAIMCTDLTYKEAGAIAFEKRKLVVTFTITQGGLGAAREATRLFLRITACVAVFLKPGWKQAQRRLFALTALTEYHQPPERHSTCTATTSDNYVSIAVEDKVKGRVEVFSGGIVSAEADFSTMPEIGFVARRLQVVSRRPGRLPRHLSKAMSRRRTFTSLLPPNRA